MPGSTPVFGWPYPTGTDRVMDGDNAIEALARAIEDSVMGLGIVGSAKIIADYALVGSPVAIPGMTFTFVAIAGHSYRLQASGNIKSSVAADNVGFALLLDGVQQATSRVHCAVANTWYSVPPRPVIVTPAAGTRTVVLQGVRFVGTGGVTVVAGSTDPVIVWAEDLGAAPPLLLRDRVADMIEPHE